MKTLRKLTCVIDHQVLNTKDYGIPQSRNRFYIVGIRKNVIMRGHKFQFPKPFNSNVKTEKVETSLSDFIIDQKIYDDESLSANQSKILDLAKLIDVKTGEAETSPADPNRMYDLNLSQISRFRRSQPNLC